MKRTPGVFMSLRHHMGEEMKSNCTGAVSSSVHDSSEPVETVISHVLETAGDQRGSSFSRASLASYNLRLERERHSNLSTALHRNFSSELRHTVDRSVVLFWGHQSPPPPRPPPLSTLRPHPPLSAARHLARARGDLHGGLQAARREQGGGEEKRAGWGVPLTQHMHAHFPFSARMHTPTNSFNHKLGGTHPAKRFLTLGFQIGRAHV